MATPRIFISMGTPYTPQYQEFQDALEALLRTRCGVDPRIIGRNEYPDGNPIHKIDQVMRSCDGVIIVAYERKIIRAGSERPGGVGEQNLDGASLTTPWNHIESAMAFTLGLPIYIIAQKGLRAEGLIETKVDWYVQEIDFSPAALEKLDVVESLKAWVSGRVGAGKHRKRKFALGFSGLKLSDLTISEWLVILSVLGAAFGSGVWAARAFPQLFAGA